MLQQLTDLLRLHFHSADVPEALLVSDVRVKPQEGAAVRSEAVHVYGSHELSARDWQNYFALYGPTAMEWVTLRSCESLAMLCSFFLTRLC